MKRLIKRIRRAFAIHNVMLRFHKCNYDIKLYDIEMENNTNWLVKQCACGKTNINRVHRESVAYMEWNKRSITTKYIKRWLESNSCNIADRTKLN